MCISDELPFCVLNRVVTPAFAARERSARNVPDRKPAYRQAGGSMDFRKNQRCALRLAGTLNPVIPGTNLPP
jgi:hypothetical protein